MGANLITVVSGESYRFWSPRTAAGHADAATALALCRRAASFGGAYVKPFAATAARDPDERTCDGD